MGAAGPPLLRQSYRQRVRFLPRSAAGTPCPHVMLLAAALAQLRKNFSADELEMARLAEKIGLAHRQLIDELVQRRLVGTDQVEEASRVGHVCPRHGTPHGQLGAVDTAGECHPGPPADMAGHRFQGRVRPVHGMSPAAGDMAGLAESPWVAPKSTDRKQASRSARRTSPSSSLTTGQGPSGTGKLASSSCACSRTSSRRDQPRRQPSLSRPDHDQVVRGLHALAVRPNQRRRLKTGTMLPRKLMTPSTNSGPRGTGVISTAQELLHRAGGKAEPLPRQLEYQNFFQFLVFHSLPDFLRRRNGQDMVTSFVTPHDRVSKSPEQRHSSKKPL